MWHNDDDDDGGGGAAERGAGTTATIVESTTLGCEGTMILSSILASDGGGWAGWEGSIACDTAIWGWSTQQSSSSRRAITRRPSRWSEPPITPTSLSWNGQKSDNDDDDDDDIAKSRLGPAILGISGDRCAFAVVIVDVVTFSTSLVELSSSIDLLLRPSKSSA